MMFANGVISQIMLRCVSYYYAYCARQVQFACVSFWLAFAFSLSRNPDGLSRHSGRNWPTQSGRHTLQNALCHRLFLLLLPSPFLLKLVQVKRQLALIGSSSSTAQAAQEAAGQAAQEVPDGGPERERAGLAPPPRASPCLGGGDLAPLRRCRGRGACAGPRPRRSSTEQAHVRWADASVEKHSSPAWRVAPEGVKEKGCQSTLALEL